MKPTLLNAIKFLAYITPFLLGFTFILLAALNGTPLPALVYFGILALTMLVISMITIHSDMPIPTGYNELCKTFGWNFYDDAYYRPALGSYFIVFTFMYSLIPMIMNSQINIFFISFMSAVLILDAVVNFGINKCYTMATYIIAVFFGIMLGGLSSALINSTNPELIFFGDKASNKSSCGMVSSKNFKCQVYKNGQLIKQL